MFAAFQYNLTTLHLLTISIFWDTQGHLCDYCGQQYIMLTILYMEEVICQNCSENNILFARTIQKGDQLFCEGRGY